MNRAVRVGVVGVFGALVGTLAHATPAASRGDAAPPDLAQAQVCVAPRDRLIVAFPDAHQATRLYVGDARELRRVPPPPRGQTGDWFFDPRHYAPGNNDNLRGTDLRVYSHVAIDATAQTCTVTCGDRATTLKLLPAGDARTRLANTTFLPPAPGHTPVALARDERGVYYYVDRGDTPDTQNAFRVFVGRKGALQKQKLTDVANDSEGQVFETKDGNLRLVIDPREMTWTHGPRTTKLLPIPLEKNLRLLYTELGVYTADRLGTPCDDL